MPYEWDYGSRLYHVTPGCNLESILQEGLRSGSSWFASRELAARYADEIRMEGEEPVAVSCLVSSLVYCARPGSLTPDVSFLTDPCIDMDLGDDVVAKLADSEAGWKGFLRSFGSVVCPREIPPEHLSPEPEAFLEREEEENVPASPS